MFHVFPRRRRGTQCLCSASSAKNLTSQQIILLPGWNCTSGAVEGTKAHTLSIGQRDGFSSLHASSHSRKDKYGNKSTGNVPVTRIAGAMFAVGDKFLDSVTDKTYSDVLWNLESYFGRLGCKLSQTVKWRCKRIVLGSICGLEMSLSLLSTWCHVHNLILKRVSCS